MSAKYTPIMPNPENPHYFTFRGKPTLLFTSGEHYSVVLNRKFNYTRYFDTLVECGFNHSRVYTGIKRERPGEHSIDGNSLAPETEVFIGPWKRTDIPGALDGGNKYDLDQWNDEYFVRLHDVIQEAGKRNIELEIILHGPLHMGGDNVGPWGVCPLNAKNNINGVGNVDYVDANSLKDPVLVAYQDRYVRKIVTELNVYDNLHYELCNEPYTHVTMGSTFEEFAPTGKQLRWAWQEHIMQVVVETEKSLPNRHMLAMNIMHGYLKLTKLMDNIDLYNFHYTNSKTVEANYGVGKAIGMNETGILASNDYVDQAWKTVVGGLGLYNMLDYSFTPGHEDGSYQTLESNPGYTGISGKQLRSGLKVVNDFINSFEFVKMRPAFDLVTHHAEANLDTYILAEENRQYALYLVGSQHSGYPGHTSVGVKAKDGTYRVEIVDPTTGDVLSDRKIEASNGYLSVNHVYHEVYNKNREIRTAVRIQRV